jgi:hypothetical protein
MMWRDDSNITVGRILSPYNGSLVKTIEMKNWEGILLLLRDTVLGDESTEEGDEHE